MEEREPKRMRVTLKSNLEPPKPPAPPPTRQHSAGEKPPRLRESTNGHTTEHAASDRVRQTVTLKDTKKSRSHDTNEGPKNLLTLRQAPAVAAKALDPAADPGPVTLDVCGTKFKVPAQLIRDKPETLLAQMFERNIRENKRKESIFIDSDATRFPLILDWYRYDEIHIPTHIPIEPVLLDARSLKLPEDIIVNGVTRSTLKPAAHRVARTLIDSVVARWPGFAEYLAGIIEKIWLHYRSVGNKSATGTPEDEAYDFPPCRLLLYGEDGNWADAQNVCSAARSRVLALKLEDRGYFCDFTDTELVVALPLRLRGEARQDGPVEELPEELVAAS